MQQYFNIIGVDRQRMSMVYAGRPDEGRNAIQLSNLSRIFIAILMIKCLIFLLSGSYILDASAKLFTIPLLFICICLLLGVCYLLESGKSFAGRVLLVSVIGISCDISVILCGGFIDSQFTPILLFPIILAFCTLSAFYSVIAIGMIVLIPLGFDLAVKSTGIKLPDFTSSNDPMIVQINLMATLFACVFFCLSYLNQSHKSEVDAEGQK